MKRKHRSYAELFRNLVTPLGALALGVVVFAATVSSADPRLGEKASKMAPAVIDISTVGPQSALAPPPGGKLHASPAMASRSDDLLPFFKANAPAGGSAVAFGRASSGGGGRDVGDACICDADCADLDDIDNCKVGVCDENQECAIENADVDTWCDLDTDFCTLDQCNAFGQCVARETSSGVSQSPCTQVCSGGTRPGKYCDTDAECPGGGTCAIAGVCNSIDERCESAGDVGRCCSPDGTTCEYDDEATCLGTPGNLWLRLGDPTDQQDTCICPKYSSGFAPEGAHGQTVGPVLPSNKVCGVGGNICEGDGFSDCPKRCNALSDTPDAICANDVDCAILGTCAIGGNVCVPSDPTTCTAGAGDDCLPDNEDASCLSDSCNEDPLACNPATKFLNVGDDYSFTNATAIRLREFRFRGGIEDPGGVLVFEFYDNDDPPKFVNAFGVGFDRVGIRNWTVTLDCYPDCSSLQNETERDPPFIVAGSGYVVMRSSRGSLSDPTAGLAVGQWVATNDADPAGVDVGVNDPNRMWIDGDPNVDHFDFGTGGDPNVLEFELVGQKVDILGACCDPNVFGACTDTTSWNCSECPDGTPCSISRECGAQDFCLPINWQGPESHNDFLFGGGKLCADDPCISGGCCDPDTGECSEISEEDCDTAGGVFNGFGTTCTPNCCPQPLPQHGADCACDTYQCSPDSGATFTGVVCDPVGNPNPPECQGSETCELLCSGPDHFVLAMPFQCRDPVFGGALDPPEPCEPGAAGDAHCESVYDPGGTIVPPSVCDLELYDFEKSIAFTGTSAGATVDLEAGDTCANDAFDVGWHEGFTLNECGIVTVDHCCDGGVLGQKTPVWIVLSDGCPCGVGGGQTVSPDTNDMGLRAGFGAGCNTEADLAGEGGPSCCPDGNFSATFTLSQGTYTWQIAAGGTCGGTTQNCDTDADCLQGVECLPTIGPYNGHFTYERCPLAACCTGESCMITDQLNCETPVIDGGLGGDWLGRGDNPVVQCLPGQDNACLKGACCTGPGACEDDAFHDELAECETEVDPDNVYHGGLTCADDPCPVCNFRTDGNCKFDDGRFIIPSDRSLIGQDPEECQAYLRRAENFRPASDTITNICWWPSYFNPFDATECAGEGGPMGGPPPPDDFLVRFFPDVGGLPDEANELGPPGGQPLVPDAKKWRGGNSRVWEYTGTLGTPIPVNPGDCYWIEITGLGSYDGNSGCLTYVLESLEGDQYGMWDGDGTYGPEDAGVFDDNPIDALKDTGDFAYCISSGLFSNDDCQVAVACCSCDGTGTQEIPIDCYESGRVIMSGQTDPGTACPALVPATNDDCSAPHVVTPADCGGDLASCQIPFDTRCATTDGPVESCFAVTGAGAGNEFIKDVWFLYTAPGSGEMTVNTCDTTNYDTMLAVFEAGDLCDECPTSGRCGTGLGQDPTCVCDDNNGDPGCVSSCFATSEVTLNAVAGKCYLIRVGGDSSGIIGSSGTGLLTINTALASLQPPALAPAPDNILKNRYISIDALTPNPGLVQFDIKATLTATLVGGVTEIGSEWWANAPNAECVSLMTPTRPATAPTWTGCNTIHLTGCGIIPTSTYDIVVADGASESAALAADTQALPGGNKFWGDCVGGFDPVADAWTPPDGLVSINDAVAAIKTFQNPANTPGCGTPPCNATHVSVTDVHPAGFPQEPWGTPNQVVDINDVFAIILGFQGKQYPGPQLQNCPLVP